MPYYLFENNGEIKEIFQHMNDLHEYRENGIKWNRIFIKPNAGIDTNWDPNSKTDFANKTGSKKGTLGEILDKSAELSSIREQKYGKDDVKENYYRNYSKTRDGKIHLNERKEKLAKITKEVTIKYNKKNK